MVQGINQIDDQRFLHNLCMQLTRELLYLNTAKENSRMNKSFISSIIPSKDMPSNIDVYKNRVIETRSQLENYWRSFLMYYKDTIDPMDPEIEFIRNTLDKSKRIY